MKKTNKANFKKIVGGVLAAVMAAAMVATAVIPAFAAEDIPVAEEVPEGVSAFFSTSWQEWSCERPSHQVFCCCQKARS